MTGHNLDHFGLLEKKKFHLTRKGAMIFDSDPGMIVKKANSIEPNLNKQAILFSANSLNRGYLMLYTPLCAIISSLEFFNNSPNDIEYFLLRQQIILNSAGSKYFKKTIFFIQWQILCRKADINVTAGIHLCKEDIVQNKKLRLCSHLKT